MAETELTVVMCYDINQAKIRRAVASLLEEKLCRVQMSVFEGRLKNSRADMLFEKAQKLLVAGDSLRMYVLTATGLEKSRTSGGAPLTTNQDFWLL